MALGRREEFDMELGPFQLGTVEPQGQVRKVLGVHCRNTGLRTTGLNLGSQPGIWPPLHLTHSPRPSVPEHPSYCRQEPPSSWPGHAPQSNLTTQQSRVSHHLHWESVLPPLNPWVAVSLLWGRFLLPHTVDI